MGWTRDKSEVEVVDLMLKLREKMVSKLKVLQRTGSGFVKIC